MPSVHIQMPVADQVPPYESVRGIAEPICGEDWPPFVGALLPYGQAIGRSRLVSDDLWSNGFDLGAVDPAAAPWVPDEDAVRFDSQLDAKTGGQEDHSYGYRCDQLSRA